MSRIPESFSNKFVPVKFRITNFVFPPYTLSILFRSYLSCKIIFQFSLNSFSEKNNKSKICNFIINYRVKLGWYEIRHRF